ncbi:unnamed protein product [Phytomonas sp. Hart1]|nr:unnamed protein product [Phytomonas sp. Hart1]|eukprot:CCW70984.1 unnamed protein product [Phytomonas sp. isolate Hart1]
MARLRSLVGAALFFMLSVFLLILACTAVSQSNAWPLVCFSFYCLATIPLYLSMQQSEFHTIDFEEGSLNTLSLFLGGVCLISGPALTLVLYHTNNISISALILTWCSGMAFLCTCMLIFASDTDDNNDF